MIELLFLFVGGLGLLYKIADMERYHQLRVVVLTALFSLAAILFFVMSVFTGPCSIAFGTCEDYF